MPRTLPPAALLPLLLLLVCAAAHAQPLKLVAVKDVWVSAYPPELDTSMGKTSELKLKGNTEVALLDFDTSALRVRRVVKAELWVHDVLDAAAREKERLDCTDGPGALSRQTPPRRHPGFDGTAAERRIKAPYKNEILGGGSRG